MKLRLTQQDKVYIKGKKSNRWSIREKDESFSRQMGVDYYIIDELPFVVNRSYRHTRLECITDLYILSSRYHNQDTIDAFNLGEYKQKITGMEVNPKPSKRITFEDFAKNEYYEYIGDDEIPAQPIEILGTNYVTKEVYFKANVGYWDGMSEKDREDVAERIKKGDRKLQDYIDSNMKEFKRPMNEIIKKFT